MLKNSASADLKLEKKAAANSQVAANEYDEIDQIYDYVRGLAALPKNLNNFEFISDPATPYAEIKLPQHPTNTFHPPKEVRDVSKLAGIGSMRSSNNYSKIDTNFLNSSQLWIKHELMEKPIPPSLKTIPSKNKQHPRRPTLVFGKNNCSTHCPKISSPQKEVTEMSPTSPLFHIR